MKQLVKVGLIGAGAFLVYETITWVVDVIRHPFLLHVTCDNGHGEAMYCLYWGGHYGVLQAWVADINSFVLTLFWLGVLLGIFAGVMWVILCWQERLRRRREEQRQMESRREWQEFWDRNAEHWTKDDSGNVIGYRP